MGNWVALACAYGLGLALLFYQGNYGFLENNNFVSYGLLGTWAIVCARIAGVRLPWNFDIHWTALKCLYGAALIFAFLVLGGQFVLGIESPDQPTIAIFGWRPVFANNVLAAPLCEELFYRGLLFGLLAKTRLSLKQQCWVLTLLFSLTHAGGFGLGFPVYVIGQIGVTLVLGYFTVRARLISASLFPGWLIHAGHNLVQFSYAFY